ncbi:hypothetical protein LC085_18895 [Bacillus tianshenii]|uniref:hypothetical protein n=1 Tax=Sutcliffiella tianshenii TaxID=1463404 RepID=UPI001CD7C755|nr:hypothetical protein [Bacillus tianshenii]MCA1321966.1 hypothetical protein [Bacillus tianshenii]
MQIGNGEYLIISTCIKGPYQSSNIIRLIQEIKAMDATIGCLNVLNVNPKMVNYNLVWEGIEGFSTPFSNDLLNQFVLSSLEISFNNDIPARLQVMFLDELSYEVSLIFNYSQLFEEKNNIQERREYLEFIEKIAIVCFDILHPLYGTYGVERSVEGLRYLIDNAPGLPCDKVFYNKILINKSVTLLGLINNANYSIENGVGVYFRNTELDNFQLVENEEHKVRLNELIESL